MHFSNKVGFLLVTGTYFNVNFFRTKLHNYTDIAINTCQPVIILNCVSLVPRQSPSPLLIFY